MKFFVFEAMFVKGAWAVAHRDYENKDLAMMNFYQVMASAYANADVTAGVCFVLNSSGGVDMSAPVAKTIPAQE
jgi:hypothetical protein